MKSKLIAVQEGLHKVTQQLKDKGYRVTSVDESNEPIDVIVYSNKNRDYLAHNMTGEIDLLSYNQFVKMINIDEVGMQHLVTSIEELE